VRWLGDQRDKSPFDTVYISGDTDSFAPPRQDKAMDLLEGVANFGVDLFYYQGSPIK
jgi:hypothetical protein